MTIFKKIAVGISGGVDSAVAALLLKNKGFDICGVFMQNWDIADEQGQCSADKDYKDAAIVCEKLGIQLHYVNFVKEYWHYVFSELIKEYENGYTPNPDILCNRYIKFDYFINYAKNNLNVDAVATGHYAKTSFGSYLENYNPKEKVKLLRTKCNIKDQTFFLSQVKEEYLRNIMFPLGNLMKTEVKEIAKNNGLNHVAIKKESMGICFIGNRNFQSFISEYIQNKPGDFIDLTSNRKVGEHNGCHQWTIGQRSRLETVHLPYYIAKKVLKHSIIYVVQGVKHLALMSDIFLTTIPHWISAEPEELNRNDVFDCEFKFQHVDNTVNCSMFQTNKGLIVSLEEPVRAITPGQYAVFYKEDECLGSAKIFHSGPCQYFLQKYKFNKNKKIINDSVEENLSDKEENLKLNILYN